MNTEQKVVCAGCSKEVRDGRYIEREDTGELVCYPCNEAAYQVLLGSDGKP